MASVMFLERPGRWRMATTAAVLSLVAVPIVSLGYAAVDVATADVGRAFWRSLATSAGIAAVGAVLGMALGLPVGVGTALTAFPGRSVALAAIALPLMAPSFLWAIGWSSATVHQTTTRAPASGIPGCILIAAMTTTALVVFTSHAAALELSRSQLDAMALAGGERAVLRQACRHALRPAIFAAALGGVIGLSDPGAAQIFGVQTAAAEILTTFAARYEIAVAARQCLILAALVAVVALPLAWIAGPRLAEAVLARQHASFPLRRRGGLRTAVACAAWAYVLAIVAPPVAGLLAPLSRSTPSDLFGVPGAQPGAPGSDHLGLALLGAMDRAAGTALNTIAYAGGAAALAVLLAGVLALAVGRRASLRALTTSACIVLFAWPSIAGALGVAHVAAGAPAMLDPLLRSRFTVCWVLGLHLTPVATVLAMRAIGAVSPSSTHAAAMHGVGVARYAARVLWPALRASTVSSFALVALLASSDAGTVLLLHPPGEASLPLTIFTVMANAPEAVVASLCLVHLLATVAVLVGVVALGALRPS